MVCMTSCCKEFIPNIFIGTGLTDGFPSGGVDAHDVRPKPTERYLSYLNVLSGQSIYQEITL